MQAQMRHKGPWLLLVNRFLPGIRGLIFVAAGAAHMPRVNALLLGALSAVAHTALVLALGVAVGGNLERLEFLVGRYQRGVILGVALVVLVLGLRTLFRRQPRTG
ncbi:DedA family protein [Cystobacter fuscus]